ncbi:MAG: cobyrinate a,c-diamide synthase [bacterium]|nr:cobyrinate a,c-diamide synthase [bacterium]
MVTEIPRLVVAGLSGDSGKTIVTSCLLTALDQAGLSVAVFKKGPDYIDAAWLSVISQTACRNLDTYLVDPDKALQTFTINSTGSEIAVIEGNRGIFDGKDVDGTHSTAELAKLVKAPIVLVVDATKATRTLAALVKGCLEFDPEVSFAGVVLNKIAGPRHKKIVTETIERYCQLPVLGALPKLGDDASLIPGRHLGLVTPAEFDTEDGLRLRLADMADRFLDTDRIVEAARQAAPMQVTLTDRAKMTGDTRIGYFKDSVFTFYYPENLEALQSQGAELVPVSSLKDSSLPALDALYIGGGFPETHAERLTANRSLMGSVKEAAEDGLPIYAECGGLIYLSRSLTWLDKKYPMAGLFDIDLDMHVKPVGHGYTSLTADRANPFFEIGDEIRGHEFHYSGPVADIPITQCCFEVNTGVGLGNGRDGLTHKNCLACYTHLHADGFEKWALAFVDNARQYRQQREGIRKERHQTAGNRSAGRGLVPAPVRRQVRIVV